MAGDEEQRDLLARMATMNPTVVLLATLALFLVVVFAPDVLGGLLILAIAAALAMLLSRTWPVLPTQARVLRLVVIGMLVAVAASKLLL